MADETTVVLRGEGGATFEVALPLTPNYEEQYRAGKLTADDEESADLLAEAYEEEDATEAGDELPPRTGSGSGKKAWLAYAEAHGYDVDPDAGYDEIVAAVEEADAAAR